jgi:hypothetical protein
MPTYTVRNVGVDPNDTTTTFLWDVLIDETSSIDRDEHDRRSLAFAFVVARDLFGFTETEEVYQRYINDRSVEPIEGQPQTMHDRCCLVYYYCWLVPMLDEQMRRGLRGRYQSDLVYFDEKLDYAIQLITPVIVSFWRYKTLQSIEKKCRQRIKAILDGNPNTVPSEIDWNTMKEAGRNRLVALTERIRKKIDKEREWLQSAQVDEQKPTSSTSGKRRRRTRQEMEQDEFDSETEVLVDEPTEKKVITLSARMSTRSASPETEQSQSAAKLRTVKFSV